MYNTDINIIASIPDFNLVTDVIGDYAQGKSEDDVYDKIFTQNIYGIRTGKSRDRFLHAIKAVFLKFKTEDHKAVFYTLFKTPDFCKQRKWRSFINLRSITIYFLISAPPCFSSSIKLAGLRQIKLNSFRIFMP